jgi:hypothetical protein
LGHHRRLESSSCRTTCGFHAVLYLYSGIRCHFHTRVRLYCSGSSMRPNLSRLRHHCRLKLSSCRTACSVTAVLIIIVASLPLHTSVVLCCFLEQYETKLVSSAASCRLKSSSCRRTCGIIANLIRHPVGQLAASLPACG